MPIFPLLSSIVITYNLENIQNSIIQLLMNMLAFYDITECKIFEQFVTFDCNKYFVRYPFDSSPVRVIIWNFEVEIYWAVNENRETFVSILLVLAARYVDTKFQVRLICEDLTGPPNFLKRGPPHNNIIAIGYQVKC